MSKTLKDKIIDTTDSIVNTRLSFNPKGNRYIMAANEIAGEFGIESDFEAVIEIARAVQVSGWDRDTLLGRNDRPEVLKLVDDVVIAIKSHRERIEKEWLK